MSASPDKHKLTHHRLCPFSRSIRLALGELGIEAELVEEHPYRWRPEFLAVNPAGDLPVLQLSGGRVLCGTYAVSEYLAEEVQQHPVDGRAVPLFPGDKDERAEIRRLVDWFHRKVDREVTRELLSERYYRPTSGRPHGPPDVEILRAARVNLRYHMTYIGHLVEDRRWLAGEELSFADLAAAAHLSSIDYLDEVPWEQYPAAKEWYVRLKSRPAFRALLADRIPALPPPPHYANLDF
jgi:glutathione S-transferase